MMVFPVFLLTVVVMLVLGLPVIALILGLIAVVNFGTAIFILTHILPALSKSRPTPMESISAG